MIKNIVFVVLILICMFGNSFGREFSSKCHPTLAYWYNQYYDLDESEPDTDEDKLSDTIIIQNRQYPILYKGDTPYIFAVLDYNGDISDLLPMGIEIMDTVSKGFSVKFPLSILPQVDSMSAVQRISCTSVNYARPIDPIKPFKLRNQPADDSLDIATFIELHKYSYSIDTNGVVPTVHAMIFTKGDYSQLDSMGINTGSKLGTTVVAWIPIALIRAINELESVEKIILPTIVRPN